MLRQNLPNSVGEGTTVYLNSCICCKTDWWPNECGLIKQGHFLLRARQFATFLFPITFPVFNIPFQKIWQCYYTYLDKCTLQMEGQFCLQRDVKSGREEFPWAAVTTLKKWVHVNYYLAMFTISLLPPPKFFNSN